MNFFSIFAAIGMLSIAGCCGLVLAWLEKKVEEEQREKEKHMH